MPDLGKYAFAVLGAYGATFALLGALLVVTAIRHLRVKRALAEVDARGQTSLPGVFAAGDCTTVPYKQIIIAMGEGAKASLGAFDHLIRTSAPA